MAEYREVYADKIFTEKGWFHDACICIDKNGQISAIKMANTKNKRGLKILPALIDTHIHGAFNFDVMDASEESLNSISRFLAAHGVCAFLATTVTESHDKIERAIKNIKKCYAKKMDGATVLGCYLEGTFFTPKNKGAHPEHYLEAPTKELLTKWINLGDGVIKCIALAPEHSTSLEIIPWLKSNGIRVMLGHSEASFEETFMALRSGADGVVHCYNGMTGLHHRNPGMVGAALTVDNCATELIVDYEHVHPAVVNITYQCCGDRLILVSDSMRATGMPNGDYYLGEQLVHMENNIVRTATGGLAGSTLTLDRACRNFAKINSIPLEEAWKHGSEFPAKALGLFNEYGSIAPNKIANLVLLNEHDDIVETIINGKSCYRNQDL